jgi:hypothetical protein
MFWEQGVVGSNPATPTIWDDPAFLNEVRTYFEQKFCLQAENSDRKK